jgi:uncharacterized protein (TIGR01440 family)
VFASLFDPRALTAPVQEALSGLLAEAGLKPGQILVIGCSTSEVQGEKIGTASSIEVAQAILDGILPLVRQHGLFLAVQCCEHLNRALVVQEACAERYLLEAVSAIPHRKAGGAFASLVYRTLEHPMLVETISAHAGMDIGDTFIGMHLKHVAVPVRVPIKFIGNAHLTLARTRPKLIGGERARYTLEEEDCAE